MDYKLSKSVEEYLKELRSRSDKGNNNQVFESFQKAIEKVLNNPASPEFLKSGTDEYRAVDVLAQRRAFFKIYKEENIVFFVWLNTDEHPHDSSKGEHDPCYKEFKKLLKNNKIQEYKPEEKSDPEFKCYGEFRKDESFYTFLQTNTSFSQAQLQLISREDSEYEVTQINENPYYSDSLTILLKKIVEKARKNDIVLFSIVESWRDADSRISTVNALKTAGFIFIEVDELGEMYRTVA